MQAKTKYKATQVTVYLEYFFPGVLHQDHAISCFMTNCVIFAYGNYF